MTHYKRWFKGWNYHQQYLFTNWGNKSSGTLMKSVGCKLWRQVKRGMNQMLIGGRCERFLNSKHLQQSSNIRLRQKDYWHILVLRQGQYALKMSSLHLAFSCLCSWIFQQSYLRFLPIGKKRFCWWIRIEFFMKPLLESLKWAVRTWQKFGSSYHWQSSNMYLVPLVMPGKYAALVSKTKILQNICKNVQSVHGAERCQNLGPPS